MPVAFSWVKQSDDIGVASASLCMVHCLATPFLFIAKSCTETCCASSPLGWQMLDALFLVVSLFAVWMTARHAMQMWIKVGLVLSWIFFSVLLLNNYIAVIPELSEHWLYVPAVALIGLHWYRKRSCGCST